MWNSYKLYKVSLDLRKYFRDEKREELLKAIDVYGIDSGAAILKFLSNHFTPKFLEEFWNGTQQELMDELMKNDVTSL